MFLGSYIQGFFAGAISAFLFYPLQLFRIKLAQDCHLIRYYSGSYGVYKDIMKHDGVFGLFRGVSYAVIGIGAY